MAVANARTPWNRAFLDSELRRIVRVVRREYAPERIILFGSVARGKASAGSDIDLAVIKRTRRRFVERSVELARLTKPRVSVDFIVYTPEEFTRLSADPVSFQRRVILGQGKLLYDVRKRARVDRAR